MKNSAPRPKFLIGNLVLALALGTLFFMDKLSEALGVWAMGLWMALAGVGIYFIMAERNDPSEPD